jgi:probable phosphoglycerate mutase
LSLYIVRHGQTDWNAEFRLQGQRDIPLNELGRRQATGNGVTLKERVADLERHHFVSSPLGRARETMELIRAAAGLPPDDYQIDERLKEISFGDWEGSTLAEIAVTAPEKIAARDADKWGFRAPGASGESYEILSVRVGAWLDSVDRPTIAVCHGGVIRCLFKLTGTLDTVSAALLDIPQDKLLRYQDGRLSWM